MKKLSWAILLGTPLVSLALPAARGQLANSPWPMFHHDVRHTGLSALYTGPSRPRLAWSYKTANEVLASPSIGSDGGVNIGSRDSYFYRIRSDGSLSWSYRSGGWIDSSAALGSDGKAYLSSWDWIIYSIGAGGSLSWSYMTGYSSNSSPALDAGGKVYIGSQDCYLYCVLSGGALGWSYKTGYVIDSSPALGADGRVYVGSWDWNLYGMNANGSLAWSYLMGTTVYFSSPALDSNGRVHVGSYDGRLHQLTSGGSFLWSYVLGDFINSSPALGSDGRAYIGSADTRLYSITSSGALSWSYRSGNWILSSPALGSDGTVYVGSNDTFIYDIHSNGTLIWSYKTGNGIYSSPALGPDRRLSIGSEDWIVYVLEDDVTSTPTPTSTPTITPTPTGPSPTPTPSPKYVLLSYFKASRGRGGVAVEWETCLEDGTVGFNLLRSDGEGGAYRTVNQRLLSSMINSPQGGIYRYVDSPALPGVACRYKLQEVTSGGSTQTYGPIRVERDENVSIPAGKSFGKGSTHSAYTKGARAASPRKITGLKTEISPRGGRRAFGGGAAGERIRIGVNERGVYALGDGQIASLLGLSAQQVRALIADDGLRLSSGGAAIGYTPAEENAGILFYGEGIESVCTDENVYWLERGEGVRMGQVEGNGPSPGSGNETVTATAHAEEEHYAVPSLFDDPHADYWFWAYILSGDSHEGNRDFPIPCAGADPLGGTAALTVYLKGGSDTAVEPDHHVRVRLNGIVLGDSFWDGTRSHEAVFTLDQGVLHDGQNTVGVTGLLDTGASYSIIHVDSLDLAYQRYYRAAGDRILCRGGSNSVVTVSGFSAPEIRLLKLADPKNPVLVRATTIDGSPGNYRISFAPESPEMLYCAFAPGAVGTPVAAAAGGTGYLRNAANRADYVIITTEELRSAARQLAGYRSGDGLETMVVTFREIIDEFNNGISSPEGIREFLSYAYRHWSRGPSYVVLCGDGTYDYKNRLGYGDSLIPPLMVGRKTGLFASDTVLGDVDGDDGIPEIAVGRLPVITPQELQVVIGKIVACEAAEGGSWTEKAIMVADNPDGGGNFTSSSDSIRDLLPDGFTANRIYLSALSPSEARRILIGEINSGAVLMIYFGHAGLDRLAQEGLLTTADVPSLVNQEKLPLVTTMACSVGKFAVPGYDCLAEELVLKSGGGAVAVWGPTSLSTDSEDRVLAEEFYLGAFGENGRNILGKLALGAAERYGEGGGSRSIIAVYNIIGDPAQRLQWEDNPPPPLDTDGDGLSDDDETVIFGTNPELVDTDDDGVNDYIEVMCGSDPLDPSSVLGSVQINFQPDSSTVPPGFIPSDARSSKPRGYGWW